MRVFIVTVIVMIPFLEMVFLLRIAEGIGFWPVAVLQITTFLIGFAIVRAEGIQNLKKVRASLGRGIVPARKMIDGILILIGGIVLFTPGVMTDLIGILLILPPVRRLVKVILQKTLQPEPMPTFEMEKSKA